LWRLGADDSDLPQYTVGNDALYTAHYFLWHGILLKGLAERAEGAALPGDADRYLTQGAELLEDAYTDAPESPDRSRQLLNAAVGYYLGGASARSYVVALKLREWVEPPVEAGLLRGLFLREFGQMRHQLRGIFADPAYSDEVVAEQVGAGSLTPDEALDRVLTVTVARALSHLVEHRRAPEVRRTTPSRGLRGAHWPRHRTGQVGGARRLVVGLHVHAASRRRVQGQLYMVATVAVAGERP
jgi:hypothetical protein